MANVRVTTAGDKTITIKDVIGFHSDKKACKEIAQPKVEERDKYGNRNAEFVDLMNISKIRHVHLSDSDSDTSVAVENEFDV